MNNNLFFSELIKKSKIKPDYKIVNKIDELDFPLKHIKFLKKDINNLLFNSFDNTIKKHKKLCESEKDLYNSLNTNYQLTISIQDKKFDLTISKNLKECFYIPKKLTEKIDSNIFNDNFIDEINKSYIIMSLIIALSLKESINFIEKYKTTYNLNSRFVYDEILSFWTNNLKNDFCYFKNLDLNSSIVIEQKEVEHCIINFYFNYYKKILLQVDHLKEQEKKIINSISEDIENFKWYVIFGTTMMDKIEKKIEPSEDSIFDELVRLTNLNYNLIQKILYDLIY